MRSDPSLRSWFCFFLFPIAGCDPSAAFGRFQRVLDPYPCETSAGCLTDVPLCDAELRQCVRCDSAAGDAGDRACAQRGAGFCSDQDGLDARGACVECRTYADCPRSAGGACWHGRCVPSCVLHTDCGEGSACDRFPAGIPGRSAAAGRGACAPREEVIHVNNTRSEVECRRADGSADRPYCALAEALDKLPAEAPRRALRLWPSRLSYGQMRPRQPRAAQVLSVYGPDEREQAEGARLDGLSSFGGARFEAVYVPPGLLLTLDRIVTQDAERGVFCDGEQAPAGVLLRRSIIRLSRNEGLRSRSCRVELDRVSARNNLDGALRLDGATRYLVQNSFLVENAARSGPIVRIANGAEGTFRFNTLAGNQSADSVTLGCGDVPRVIAASIFAQNLSRERGQAVQTTGACALQDVVADDDTLGAARGRPAFLRPGSGGDYRLADAPESRACCVDRVTESDLGYDVDGLRRPAGAGIDVGASELGSGPLN